MPVALLPLPPDLTERIPLDVHLQVIEWLTGDPRSLCNCASSGSEHARVRERLADTLELVLTRGSGRASESLTVTFVECLPAPLHHLFLSALHACERVTNLTLYGVMLESHKDLVRIIRAVPQLHRLALEGDLRFHRAIPVAQAQDPAVRSDDALGRRSTRSLLKHLRVTVSNKDSLISLVDCLIHSSLCVCVEHLECSIAGKHVAALNNLLRAIGPSLRHFRELPALTETFAHLDLHRNTSLATAAVLGLEGVFSSIHSPNITHITLQFNEHPPTKRSQLAGSATTSASDTYDGVRIPLHEVMAMPVFDGLRIVEVGVEVYRTEPRDVASTLSVLLTPWEERGIIRYSGDGLSTRCG
ncbi:uncharacterized protein B0H18DRAFT_973626 [Fomitopsis serialis]|uniref:uncharacterized protein n=1 Tax=Fomitopsis serialis TaxID=139415 RepID=UPI0020084410|nr:uncharacterized protein B0H18DRAFT_973626 [Neoantrodia serialis]KAH9936377.1 hypothetical protein B0H18DRAFT_973626 [Neoantrodia serialis]